MALRKVSEVVCRRLCSSTRVRVAYQSTQSSSLNPRRKNDELQKKVSLITGSTGGIGMSIAQHLAAKGSDVILTGSGKKDYAEKMKQEFRDNYGVEAHYVYADLSDQTEIAFICQKILKIYPDGVDILVNNAGFQHVCPILDFPEEKWQRMIAVMLTAPFYLIKYLSPNMIEKNWGRIVNISSAHGVIASPNKAAYVSAKHGIVGLTKVTALEMARHGITCNAICPGFVKTPILTGQVETLQSEMKCSYQEAEHAFLAKYHATQECIELDHLSDMVGFLCSDSAQQITGSSLVIDGGWTAK